MNATETREMIGAICPDLNLDGCYAEIMPRVTDEQLAQLLETAEQGGNAGTWSWLAVQFFRYGQQDVVAESIDRLVAAVTDSYDAAVVLVEAPNLTAAHRDTLVPLVADSDDAAWVARYAPNLTDEHRDALVEVVTDSHDAAWLLWNDPNLSDEQRDILEKVAEQ